MNLPVLRRGGVFLGAGIITVAALTAGTTASASPDTALPAPAPASAPAVVTLNGARASQEAANKRIATAFLDLAVNQKKPREAAARYLGAPYIQHNPQLADGKEAFVAWAEAFIAAAPEVRMDFKRVLADGDLVMLHSHVTTSPSDRGTAAADILRLRNGRIVEHWDVLQAVPETSANGNTMF
ncbi:nuclear transport factor 2 family protein [Streptomyces sp. T028]|uniref:nuclear transport factor 2 family protein n=1 Tax=Streptomyces sp. T028 TaxID=3394379 RepID=UPI003A8AD2C4